ncbi:MAG: ATP-binding protein [Leptospirales bacterium]|nr:ATP-binding protein [Leptospirales bacterium]
MKNADAEHKISGFINAINNLGDRIWNKLDMSMQRKLLILFLIIKILPLILLAFIAWWEFLSLGTLLKEVSVKESTEALNDTATENIERLTTDTAKAIADFLYERDGDILYLSRIQPSWENYNNFIETRTGKIMDQGQWVLSGDGKKWENNDAIPAEEQNVKSTNKENNDRDGFNYRVPDDYVYKSVPFYDEVTFIGLDGNEIIKVCAKNSTKKNYPMNRQLKNVSNRFNTYIKAETYFEKLRSLKSGEIYVSDVIGAYVGSNYVGMYTPAFLKEASKKQGHDIEYEPEKQAYAGYENPNGQRFEGIIRWVTPVTDRNGNKTGYVSFALNHDHIMKFVDHITPMTQRYIKIPSAFEGNYAFIWDYNCRSICHPRHHSITGYDPVTGESQIPWLEQSIYDEWEKSGKRYIDFIKDVEVFDNQSRTKKPAAQLTRQGLVGLDGRYLNNAPQCTGWMNLTEKGGSGSFYILWSGLYKLTTAAAIPYYTGKYAPSQENNFSKRGFAFVTIGAGLDDFTKPAQITGEHLSTEINKRLFSTTFQLFVTTFIIMLLVIFVAFWMASFLTSNISRLNQGIARFRAGERQFRFNTPVKDEFGILADSFDDMANSLADSIKNPLTITNNERKIIYMNDIALKLLHKPLDEMIGKSYSENSLYPTNTVYDPILALHKEEEAFTYHYKEGDLYFKGTANYLLGRDNSRTGYIINSGDVTYLMKAQIELERLIGELNKANEHKNEFLARMSHEIRTPMNAIIGLTDIVQRKILELKETDEHTEEISSQMEKIGNSSQHLLSLLNDILDLSKIDSGKIELNSETMALHKLILMVKEIIKPRCDEKNISFNVAYDDFETITFLGDPLRLRQVLINFLSNAVKFTPEYGKINFTVSNLEQKNNKYNIRFSVKDTGIGISPDKIEKIFEPFEQESGETSKKYGGTGLGLSITKRIVELFGGEIIVNSKPGEGSEFSFVIWLEETEHKEQDKTALDVKDRFTNFRALIVDDVELNRLIVTSLLETTGMQTDEADDGTAAVEMFEKSDIGTYDIIFMDVQMPEMDGYEAASRIRAMERADAKTVTIIALTANAFKDDIDKALQSGMNNHLAKPIDFDKLMMAVVEHLDSRQS